MSLHTSDSELIKPQWKARLQDPLSASTRGERRLLLVLSTVTLLMVVIGLFPTKVEALGIAFESKNRLDLIMLLGAANVYALVGFVIYAWADFHLLLRSHRATTTGYIDEFTKGRASRVETFNFVLRFVFDLVVPVVYGIYALYMLAGVRFSVPSA